MPTIRFLTPADFGDMCDIIDKHSSGPGAWCNDETATVQSAERFRQAAKDHVDQCFFHGMAHFWGAFDDAGKLVAWTLFVRWPDHTNITLRLLIEDPQAGLQRADRAVWSDAAVDLVNWGLNYFRPQGVDCFWARLYNGREDRHISLHPKCLLREYKRENVAAVPSGTIPPEEYRRVSWLSVDYDTTICRFTA
jgi:hypothetical protein